MRKRKEIKTSTAKNYHSSQKITRSPLKSKFGAKQVTTIDLINSERSGSKKEITISIVSSSNKRKTVGS